MNGKNIEKLQSSLHYLEGATEGEGESGGSSLKKMVGKKRKHTVFLEGGRKQAEELHVAKDFNTLPELMGRAFNCPGAIERCRR